MMHHPKVQFGQITKIAKEFQVWSDYGVPVTCNESLSHAYHINTKK